MARSTDIVCVICQKPLVLETALTNEHGKAVHADCYAMTLVSNSTNILDYPSTVSAARKRESVGRGDTRCGEGKETTTVRTLTLGNFVKLQPIARVSLRLARLKSSLGMAGIGLCRRFPRQCAWELSAVMVVESFFYCQ